MMINHPNKVPQRYINFILKSIQIMQTPTAFKLVCKLNRLLFTSSLNIDKIQSIIDILISNYRSYIVESLIVSSCVQKRENINILAPLYNKYRHQFEQIDQQWYVGERVSCADLIRANMLLTPVDSVKERLIRRHAMFSDVFEAIKQIDQTINIPSDKIIQVQYEPYLNHDDIDGLVSSISNPDDISHILCYEPYYIYDTNQTSSLIDYAAFAGALKCFKFLYINKSVVTDKTLLYSLIGGNHEIIKICANDNISGIHITFKDGGEAYDYLSMFVEHHHEELIQAAIEHQWFEHNNYVELFCILVSNEYYDILIDLKDLFREVINEDEFKRIPYEIIRNYHTKIVVYNGNTIHRLMNFDLDCMLFFNHYGINVNDTEVITFVAQYGRPKDMYLLIHTYHANIYDTYRTLHDIARTNILYYEDMCEYLEYEMNR